MMAKKLNRNKHFSISRIEIDGVDKSGKNLLVNYIALLTNHTYVIYARGILSQLVYENEKEVFKSMRKDNSNTIVIHLWGNLKDLEIRHKISNEPTINILEHRNEFFNMQKLLLDNGIFVFNYNTSNMTPFQIAKDIIYILEYIESEEF